MRHEALRNAEGLLQVLRTGRSGAQKPARCPAVPRVVAALQRFRSEVLSSKLECHSADPFCGSNLDGFAVSSTDLAYRAIALRECDTKHFETLKGCYKCYAQAGLVLRSRLDAPLFHGL